MSPQHSNIKRDNQELLEISIEPTLVKLSLNKSREKSIGVS